MREEVISALCKEKIIAIVRGLEMEECIKTAEALYQGGICAIEMAFNQKRPETFRETADQIAAIRQKYQNRMWVGAGTVTSVELADLAASAGAQYIISPDKNEAVIKRTRERNLVSIPGAATPTEIVEAYRAGADFVKLFPAGNLGTDYVKAICTPLNHIRLLAVGGIDVQNIAEFLDVGMAGAGIGGNLVNKKWIHAGEYEKITEAARSLVNIVSAYKNE